MTGAAFAVFGLAVGIVAADAGWGPVAAVFCLMLGMVQRRWVRICCLGVVAGCVIWSGHVLLLGAFPMDMIGERVTVEGTVSGVSERDWGVRLTVEQLAVGWGYRGALRVDCSGEGYHVGLGDRVRVSGVLSEIRGATNPGLYDGKRGLAAAGVFYQLRVGSVKDVAVCGRAGWLYGWRQQVTERIVGNGGDPGRRLLLALVVGNRSFLSDNERSYLSYSGLGHVTAVSGFHVSLVAAVARLVLGKNPLPAAAVVGMYVMLVGLRPSVTRAAVMTLLSLWGCRGSRYEGLAVGAGVVLTSNPFALWDPGFQLSVAAVWGMLLPIMGWGKGFMVEMLRASLKAQLGAFPVMLYHFGAAPVVGVVINVMAVPLAAGATVMGLVGSVIGDWAGAWLVWAGARLSALLLSLAALAGSTWWAGLRVPGFGIVMVAAWLGVVLLISKSVAARWRFPLAISVAVMVVVQVGLLGGALELWMFDVGQGDGAMITTPGGQRVVIDTGLDQRMARILMGMGVRDVAVVIITHAHADHAGGLADIVECVGIGMVIDHGQVEMGLHADVRGMLSARGIVVWEAKAGDVWELDGVRFEVVSPPVDRVGWSENDNSVGVMVRFGNFAAVFAGDMEQVAEHALVNSGMDVRALLLKVGHHGSDTSTSEGFLEAVRPVVAVISVGPNRHGHPSVSVLERLADRGVIVCRTDEVGAIRVKTDGRRWRVDSWLGGRCY